MVNHFMESLLYSTDMNVLAFSGSVLIWLCNLAHCMQKLSTRILFILRMVLLVYCTEFKIYGRFLARFTIKYLGVHSPFYVTYNYLHN